MKLQNTLLLLSLCLSITLIAQENEKRSYEKFKVGFGAVHQQYLGWSINSPGLKFEAAIPVYKRFSANLNYTDLESYFDYCDEIPVSVGEQHFVVGANYTFLERSKWTFAALAAFDIERTTYTEVDHLPKKANVFHTEGAHEETHDYTESYTEFLLGIEVNYSLSNRLQLSFSSRLNSYTALSNSLSLFYLFEVGKN